MKGKGVNRAGHRGMYAVHCKVYTVEIPSHTI